MSRLNRNSLGLLRRNIDCDTSAYDRDDQQVGIVHFGIGAFHRAHQAWYTDRAMSAGARDWMIAGVSLRSPAVMAQLNPQDGLYTLTERSGSEARTRLIGAVREVLVADRHPRSIADRIASPHCRMVTFTVTEKGYARAPDGKLEFAAAEHSFYPLLVEGLARRRSAGLPGVTLLSCDNLADNGREVHRLLASWIEARAPDLAAWFDHECTCPNSMVDRIVPATTPADLARVTTTLGGIRDEGAVFAERFSQWAIEDRFAGPRPPWEDFGAQLVGDVAPFETAKLRMLNGAHSALAYLGLARDYVYVHQAIADSQLRSTVEALMRREAAPTIVAAPGQDLATYADELLTRFADPALNHRLAQIAMDGSQKIPQRWLATLAIREERGQPCSAIRSALSAWFEHLRRGEQVDDPRAVELRDIVADLDGGDALARIFGADWRKTATAG